MSEYQYYEFATVDRPLTAEYMRRLRALSSRATITPTRFSNFYTWGDFKGDPAALMDQYFDAFVYVANWGAHELMLRLPRRQLSSRALHPYRVAESVRMWSTADHVMLAFRSDDDSGTDFEDDGEGWMSALLPLRAEIAAGDQRALYLGWLCGAQTEQLADQSLEPAVPAGLASLTTAQQALAAFLRLEPDLLTIASQASLVHRRDISRQSIEAWLHGLADAERIELLVRLVADDHPQQLRAELVQRVMQSSVSDPLQALAPAAARRTVRDLLTAAAQRTEARQRAAAEQADPEGVQLERARAAARVRYLESLVGRDDELWQRVETLVATRRQSDYDRAVAVIRDLRDAATRTGQMDTFVSHLERLHAQHVKKISLLDRLEKAGLRPSQLLPLRTGPRTREM
jgi:hypothetical protein